MFIPTPYTGKGKPFAFLPETISPGPWDVFSRSSPPPPAPSQLYMSCYWQEIKAGKLLVCYGSIMVSLDKKFFPNGINNSNFSFDTFLEFAGSEAQTSGEKFKRSVMEINSVTAIYKLGHQKPWKSWHLSQDSRTPYFDEQAAYDPQILANLLANPSQVPAGAVGWFKLVTNKRRKN